jgi:hypothetical protein
MFKEARMYARAYRPGADPPDIRVKTLAFTEADLKKIIKFILSSENSSGLAWGEKILTWQSHKMESQYSLMLTWWKNMRSNHSSHVQIVLL